MLVAAAATIITALIVASAAALADILENSDLPRPVRGAWVLGVLFAPGLAPALWFGTRARALDAGGMTSSSSKPSRRITGREVAQMHHDIQEYLLRQQ
jgi:hypothetical protein